MRRPPPPPPPPPPHLQIVRYLRTVRATLDRTDRASIVRFLTGSTWDLASGGDRIKFVDPVAGHFAKPPGGERGHVVAIRELERVRGGILVGIDGVMFTLTTCRDGRAVSTCLERTTVGNMYGGGTYGGF